MFCPKCKSEYKEGILICPECNVELVENLPEDEVEYMPDKFKLLYTFYDPVSANLAKGLLVENGIAVKLEDISFTVEPVFVSSDMTRLKLWVKEDDFDKAEKILKETENYHLCPACGRIVLKDEKICPWCDEKLSEG